ncbi:Synaptonemal Complex Central Element Protein 1-Like [Manis pentadactyla]|nr:Synaptonemal Complex Central Element Protein 1-Like [Manis pentadactyla]
MRLLPRLKLEGSLEPQIKDLINRINELQQGCLKMVGKVTVHRRTARLEAALTVSSSLLWPSEEEISENEGEAHTPWESLHRELDSLNAEKVHLEEVLSIKQGNYTRKQCLLGDMTRCGVHAMVSMPAGTRASIQVLKWHLSPSLATKTSALLDCTVFFHLGF